MKLNMKANELGIVVNGKKSAGRIVRTIEECKAGDEFSSQCGRLFQMGDIPGFTWHIDGLVYIADLDAWCPIANDEDLRPIRDNDGEDETLTWAGKPEEVTA